MCFFGNEEMWDWAGEKALSKTIFKKSRDTFSCFWKWNYTENISKTNQQWSWECGRGPEGNHRALPQVCKVHGESKQILNPGWRQLSKPFSYRSQEELLKESDSGELDLLISVYSRNLGLKTDQMVADWQQPWVGDKPRSFFEATL